MNKIIGHLVGLDEIHKNKLIKMLPSEIKIIDLDEYQQLIYNHPDITKLKLIWGQISREIQVSRKQERLIGSKRTKSKNIVKHIKKLLEKRNRIRNRIHLIWKEKMIGRINSRLSELTAKSVLFLGFNIFPKDYRQKINLPLRNMHSGKLIIDLTNKKYASNQIKYYLDKYSEKIIKGTFPLNLLKTDYLTSKYDKFTSYYHKHGYNFIPSDKIIDTILKLEKEEIEDGAFIKENNVVDLVKKSKNKIKNKSDKNSSINVILQKQTTSKSSSESIHTATINELQLTTEKNKFPDIITEPKIGSKIESKLDKKMYVATLFKSGKYIPVNHRTPLEGFISKEEAIKVIRLKINKPTPVYIYQVNGDQFELINKKFIATKPVEIISEESTLMSVNKK